MTSRAPNLSKEELRLELQHTLKGTMHELSRMLERQPEQGFYDWTEGLSDAEILSYANDIYSVWNKMMKLFPKREVLDCRILNRIKIPGEVEPDSSASEAKKFLFVVKHMRAEAEKYAK